MDGKIKNWIPLGFVITALCGLVYLTGHQNLRQNANDPQIQMSEDIAERLATNPHLPSLTSANAIDISKSLSTYIIIYNDQGKPVLSTAKLDGQIPNLPSGVLDYTRVHHQNRLSWQPKPGVRSAIVVTRYEGKTPGFVLVGRSLREVEVREDTLLEHVEFAWVVTLVGSLIAFIVFVPKLNKKK